MATLTDEGISIPFKKYIEKDPQIKKKELLNFEATFRINRSLSKTTTAYKLIGPNIHIPRYGAFEMLRKKIIPSIENNITEGIYCKNMKYAGSLKKNQKTVLKHLCETYFNKKRCKKGNALCTLVMKAGRGKSYLSMGLMHMLKQKTLIIVPTDKVMFGWKKALVPMFPDSTVGIYYGKKKEDCDITIMMIHSALTAPQEFINKFGLVIYDEIHKYCGPKQSQVFWKLSRPYVFGITATPDRPQKEDIIFRSHIGPIVKAEEIEGYIKDDVKFEGIVKIIDYEGPPQFTRQLRNPTTLNNSAPALINQIAKDPYRNQLIVMEILEIFDKKQDVFVFSDRLEHLHILEIMLKTNLKGRLKKDQSKKKKKMTDEEIEKYINERVAVLTGGASEEYTRQVFDHSIIILTTYPSSDTGVSIDRMTGIVFTTPRRNLMEQKVGRILRIGGDLTIVRQLVDIVDTKVALSKQIGKRRAVYKAEGFVIKKVKANWEDYQNYISSSTETDDVVETGAKAESETEED